MRFLIILVVLIALCHGLNLSESEKEEWEQFKVSLY